MSVTFVANDVLYLIFQHIHPRDSIALQTACLQWNLVYNSQMNWKFQTKAWIDESRIPVLVPDWRFLFKTRFTFGFDRHLCSSHLDLSPDRLKASVIKKAFLQPVVVSDDLTEYNSYVTLTKLDSTRPGCIGIGVMLKTELSKLPWYTYDPKTYLGSYLIKGFQSAMFDNGHIITCGNDSLVLTPKDSMIDESWKKLELKSNESISIHLQEQKIDYYHNGGFVCSVKYSRGITEEVKRSDLAIVVNVDGEVSITDIINVKSKDDDLQLYFVKCEV